MCLDHSEIRKATDFSKIHHGDQCSNTTIINAEHQKITLTLILINHTYFGPFPTFHLMKSEDIIFSQIRWRIKVFFCSSLKSLPTMLIQSKGYVLFSWCSHVEAVKSILHLNTDRAIKLLSSSPEPVLACCIFSYRIVMTGLMHEVDFVVSFVSYILHFPSSFAVRAVVRWTIQTASSTPNSIPLTNFPKTWGYWQCLVSMQHFSCF